MTSQQQVGTPFANSQWTQLSADAPEFVASPGRSKSHSLLKAKDSVSSMTDTETTDTKAPTPEPTQVSVAADASAGRDTEAASQSSPVRQAEDSKPADTAEASKAAANRPSATNAGTPKHDAAGGRPPSQRRGNSLGSNGSGGRRHPQASPPQLPYPDMNFGRAGQPLLLPGSPGQFFQPQPYGGPLVPMPVPMPGNRGQMLFPPNSPVHMMPWQQGLMPMIHMLPDQYNQGFPGAQLQMLPNTTLPGGFYPPGSYEEHYAQSYGPPLMEGQGHFHSLSVNSSPSSLNAAAPRWLPDESNAAARSASRATGAAAASSSQPRRGAQPDAMQQQRTAEGEAPTAGRTSSNGSERQKGHRRMVSVPVEFPVTIPEASEPSTTAPEDKEPRPKRRGHRRQASLPNASDMERLREGGHRKGRHSRSDSWFSNSRTSVLLEEFKSTREGERKWTLSDVKGHVIEFCKDQTGSRFIQQALEEPDTTPEQIQEVAIETKPRFSMLMEDVFGNYVIQKLLERTAPAEKKWMADRICRDNSTSKVNQPNRAVALSKHQYGCRVVQKALETLELDDKIAIMEQLLESTLDLVADQNGNHVIQKCVECIKPTSHIAPLIDELLSGRETRSIPTLRGEVVPLSQHTYGCRVVQRVLEHCDEPRFKQRFMVEILKDVHTLSKNIYSNYVIQHVLEYGEPAEREQVLNDLSDHMLVLSRDKFASNVVERCLKHGTGEQQRAIINQFLRSESAFVQMMKDDYGNYVCFSAFEVADAEQRQQLAEVIKRSVAVVRRTSFGKNFHAKLAEKYPETFGDLSVHPGKGPQSTRGPHPRLRQQPGRMQPLAIPLVNGQPAAARLQSPRGGTREAPKPKPRSSKAEGSGKPAAGQVSVMADGANPPVYPPMPAGAQHVGDVGVTHVDPAAQEPSLPLAV